MHRCTIIAAATLAATGPALGGGQIPGTLNFANQTGSRINQTNPEASNNEKEVEFGDFDADKDLDVVIAVAYSDFGARDNKLYRNDGGVFNEVSDEVPLFTTLPSGDVARNAFFRDYDKDGWLDIIIVCDANTGGDGGRTKLWINQVEGGVHVGWSEEGNTRLGANTGGAACSAVSFDPDKDGDADLYVGNYPGPSQDTMYFNNDNNPGFFDEVTGTHVPIDGDYTVDVATADLNGDGKVDLLVSNGFSDPNWVYYNDNQGAGSGTGDFRYAGSGQSLGLASFENAMEPGDFDGDDDVDFYWSNRSGAGDRILRNEGNDVDGKATFTELFILPSSVTTQTSRKATVADLNGDGRPDVVVGKDLNTNNRPTVLRNTSVNGSISFVDWTPASAFPTGSAHRGWHAAVFDTNGDGDLDIFLGGWAGDHLFEQVPPSLYDERDLNFGVIPEVVNQDAAAVVGTAGLGQSDTFTIDEPIAGFVSLVLNGPDDYLLELLDDGGAVLATADRGALGVEEALQLAPPGSPPSVQVRVTVQGCVGGAPADFDGDCLVGVTDLITLLSAWGDNPGHPADLDGDDTVGINDLIMLLAGWGGSEYVLEVLSRTG